MKIPHRIEQEMLLALYRYSMLTTDQLSTLLHYKIDTIYKTSRSLRHQEWIESQSLDFIRRNTKGWVLTRKGIEVAFGLTKEHRPYLLRQTNAAFGQAPHLFGVNRFFTDLIRHSLTRRPEEGLIDWIGMRDGGERYAIVNRKNQRTTPLRPDGIGTYRFANSSEIIFHVEYDTGSEHLWVLHGKLWKYVDVLKTFWADVTLANVLFITRDPRRSARILELWQGMRDDAFRKQPTPTVWTTTEDELSEQGTLAPVWQGLETNAVSFLDFPRLSGGNGDRSVPIGKQTREQPFAKPSRIPRSHDEPKRAGGDPDGPAIS
ncbi:replication-relaxation family protein [Ferroacidibacillus organovorans]|uniref:Replication-relaxation n=1 Tax=Ferroacidibacillus organovorans TaxID=1765683 RepID=A0A853KEI8_9BACL|nr:replication-relaxation family protein [Ferroacidibacillus organovorans]KYP79873.1 hypothetical protein AYJ22_02960 [Ferroacidibacillus organovorans]OAG94649.1 hypothetical protein AYW79_04655 [Ferroacidibacillus organovorans]